MVAECSAEGDEVRTFAEMDRSEGVAESVKSGPRRPGLLHQRLQHPLSKIVWIERAAALAREEEIRRLARYRVEVSANLFGEWAGQADVATPTPRLRRTHETFDQRSADADFGRPVVQLEVEALERNRLADS